MPKGLYSGGAEPKAVTGEADRAKLQAKVANETPKAATDGVGGGMGSRM